MFSEKHRHLTVMFVATNTNIFDEMSVQFGTKNRICLTSPNIFQLSSWQQILIFFDKTSGQFAAMFVETKPCKPNIFVPKPQQCCNMKLKIIQF